MTDIQTDRQTDRQTEDVYRWQEVCQEETLCLGNIYGEKCGTGYAGNVWDKNHLGPVLMTMAGGNRQPMIIEEDMEGLKIRQTTKRGYVEAVDGDSINLAYPEPSTRRGRVGNQISQTLQCNDNMGVVVDVPFIVRSTGRNPENPSDRRAGIPTKQRLEPKFDGSTNTLTTVQKDNLLNEKVEEDSFGTVSAVNPMEDGTCRTLKNQYHKNSIQNFESLGTYGATGASNGYGIRKLTPKECFRLMGYRDEDFDRAAEVNSNSQLYKQAGNAIVEGCLMAIFSQLNIKGVKPWNDMTEEERDRLVNRIS